jgi:hypothetical protein
MPSAMPRLTDLSTSGRRRDGKRSTLLPANRTFGPDATVLDKDLEVLSGVTGGDLGEELDGAAQGQVGRSWQHRGASAVGAAETPRWHAEVDANPQLMGPV